MLEGAGTNIFGRGALRSSWFVCVRFFFLSLVLHSKPHSLNFTITLAFPESSEVCFDKAFHAKDRAATNDYFSNQLICRFLFRLINESDKKTKKR